LLNPELALLVVGGSAIAGFVSGLAGFAFGLVAMVFWAWTLPPQAIGPMLVVGSLAGQLLTVNTVRGQLQPKVIWAALQGWWAPRRPSGACCAATTRTCNARSAKASSSRCRR
jgi:hypothetical protein